jgi:hypothetical protein
MACASRERTNEAPVRRFWDWVGVAAYQGQAGHNIVKGTWLRGGFSGVFA